MEQDIAQESLESKKRLKPPGEGKITSILNGAGNWAMMAGAPFLLWEMLEKEKAGTNTFRSRLAFASVAGGTLLGAVNGWFEAERMHAYRQSIADEVADLRKEIVDTRKSHATHLEREHQRQAESAAREEHPAL